MHLGSDVHEEISLEEEFLSEKEKQVGKLV